QERRHPQGRGEGRVGEGEFGAGGLRPEPRRGAPRRRGRGQGGGAVGGRPPRRARQGTGRGPARDHPAGHRRRAQGRPVQEGEDAGADVKEAEAELIKAKLEARAADIDPEANPTQKVKDAQKDLDDARNAFAIADGNYLPANVKALDAWEAAVPDATWRHLAD